MKVTRVLSFLNNIFILMVIFAIFSAYLYPELGAKGGILKPEITVKYGSVIVIFLISGLSLESKDLAIAAYQYHIHIFIQCFSFICIPVIVQIFVHLFSQVYSNSDLLIGFVAVSCMPPPVSSAVLLTKSAGGNEAAAVFNSALGSFLGIIFTPTLLYLLFGSSANVPIFSAISQLSMTVVLPVMLGQWLRTKLKKLVIKYKKKLSDIGSFMLLLIIYSTFCETFSKQDKVFTFPTVIVTSMAVILLQLILLSVVFYTTKHLKQLFSSEDSVAIFYCSTHKSLTLGFPLLKVLYGSETRFALISFPLLVYHPMQILIGSMFVPALQKYIHNSKGYKSKLHPV